MEQERVVSISEKKAQMKVLKRCIQKAQREGYSFYRLLTVEQVTAITKKSLPLGLNGMYLLMFWTIRNEKAKSAHEITDVKYIVDYFKDWSG